MTSTQNLNTSYAQEQEILPYNQVDSGSQVWSVDYEASGITLVDLIGSVKCTARRPFKPINQDGDQVAGALELKTGMEIPVQTGYRVYSDGGRWGGTNLQAEGFALSKVGLQLGDGALALLGSASSLIYLAF